MTTNPTRLVVDITPEDTAALAAAYRHRYGRRAAYEAALDLVAELDRLDDEKLTVLATALGDVPAAEAEPVLLVQKGAARIVAGVLADRRTP